MARIPDDSHDYHRLEAVSDRDSPRFGNGCFSTGLAAALGGSCIAMCYSIGSRDRIHGNEIVAACILFAIGLLFIFAAGRNGFRNFGLANTAVIFALSVTPGSCIGLTLIPEGHGSAAAKRTTCQNNLKQMGLVCYLYANENPAGTVPQLSSEAGRLMFDNEVADDPPIYPELLTDLSILYCPEAEERPDFDQLTPERAMDDHAYFYLGYAITNQEQLEAFAESYRATIASGGTFSDDIVANGNTLHRLQPGETNIGPGPEENVAPSEIPMLIERPGSHLPRGGNVLYADGHVEFIKWGTKWPMTLEAMDVLLALDGLAKD